MPSLSSPSKASRSGGAETVPEIVPTDARARLRELSFNDLRLFVHLYENRSLQLAAAKLDLNLSTASRQLKRIREALGDELFVRSNPGLHPTPRAEVLYPTVRAILGLSEELVQSDVFVPSELTRTFRIGAVDNAVFSVMPEVIREFFHSAPNASIEVMQLPQQLFEALARGEIDLAVFPSTRPIPANFHSMKLFPETYALCVREDHPLAKRYRETGELTREEIHRYRKIVISNRGAGERPLYCLDETTFLGHDEQARALTMPWFLTVPGLLERTDFTAILPLGTALRLQESLRHPLAVIPCNAQLEHVRVPDRDAHERVPNDAAQPGVHSAERPVYYTRIIWHERVHRDPAVEWLRGLFAIYAASVADALAAASKG